MNGAKFPLRPFLPSDTLQLRELFAASIEELTQEDYDEDQRAAWASAAEDTLAFAKRLGSMLTLVVMVDGEHAGFASLKDGKLLDMLYVHPFHVRAGIGAALADALEKIAFARGADAVTVEASDTAAEFFESRGYMPMQRNSVPIGDLWMSNTTMKKQMKPAPEKTA